MEEGGRKKEGEEYQTHLEEELAESQAQRAALLEEGASNDARTEVPEHSSCRDSLITGADMTNCAEGWRPGAGVRGLKCSGGWFAKTGDKGGVDGGRGGVTMRGSVCVDGGLLGRSMRARLGCCARRTKLQRSFLSHPHSLFLAPLRSTHTDAHAQRITLPSSPLRPLYLPLHLPLRLSPSPSHSHFSSQIHTHMHMHSARSYHGHHPIMLRGNCERL